jgi:hypothetical protein
MTAIAVTDLTQSTLEGTGIFDVLMRANKAHLEAEFNKNRIKGAEYATVYLGSLTQVMQTALQFLLTKEKTDLEAQLLQKQILLAQKQIDKATAELLQIEAQTALVNQQKLNAITENTVLVAQECKLRAEFDLITSNTLKSNQETALLTQKTATERAQITALGVDADSVVGRQKALYVAQTNGFTRDAEQKAAKLMVDTWNVRRTTDEGTVADAVNNLNDAAVGRAVTKLLAGVQA